jgi:hypothetical protein
VRIAGFERPDDGPAPGWYAALPSDHYLPEEAPAETVEALGHFLS